MSDSNRVMPIDEQVAQGISSASRLPTFQHAVILAVQSAIASGPNSIRIGVDLRRRGFSVKDNGSGLEPEQASSNEGSARPVSLCSSALHDLGNLSRLTIISKSRRSGAAFARRIEFGQVLSVPQRENACFGCGTYIQVLDLFSSIPVRQKMMDASLAKSCKVLASVCFLVQRMVLVHREIKWVLVNEADKSLLVSTMSSPRDLAQSFIAAFGHIPHRPIHICQTNEHVSIEGLIWSWTDHIDIGVQLVFVNKQAAECPHLVEKFQSTVMSIRGLFSTVVTTPVAFVFDIHFSSAIVMPSELPGMIIAWPDRFPTDLKQCFYSFLSRCFEKLFPNIQLSPEVKRILIDGLKTRDPSLSNQLRDSKEEVTRSDPNVFAWAGIRSSSWDRVSNRNQVNKRFCRREPLIDHSGSHTDLSTISTIKLDQSMLLDAQVINQVDKKFIILKIPFANNIMIVAVDQHAADERIRLEALESQIIPNSKPSARIEQILLDPVIILDWPANDIMLVDAYKNQIEMWGFQVIRISQGRMALRCTPSLFGVTLTTNDLLEFVRSLHRLQGRASLRPPRITNILCSKACRSAIMFGDELSRQQCEEIIKQLSTCQYPFQCAHGRPSAVPIGIVSQQHK